VAEESSLFIVSAPSGAGKTSLCKEAIKLIPNLHFSISCTTRPPRQHEKNGVDYYFVSIEEFTKMVVDDQLIEWTNIYGNYYGTAKAIVEKCRNQKKDIIFDIDHVGAQRIKETYVDSITIFILPPSYKELEERLTQRGTESETILKIRLNKAKNEIEQSSWYQYRIVNDDFDEAVKQLHEIITTEHSKKKCR
jgi:guanylate kinase